MKKIILLLVLGTVLGSCISQSTDSATHTGSVPRAKNIDAFTKYQCSFQNLPLDSLNMLNAKFNSDFLVNEELQEIPKELQKQFLSNIVHDDAYYGYKTILPDSSVLLTYFLSHGDATKEVIVDTSYFCMVYYTADGKPLSHLRVAGSNLLEIDPTYNMVSTFETFKNTLLINVFQYVSPSGPDKTYVGSLNSCKYRWDLVTGERAILESKTDKATIEYFLVPEGPTILRLKEPSVNIKYY
ncbi:MAG: hypothetical protein V4615_02460 [Bacteroidota bacterium]